MKTFPLKPRLIKPVDTIVLATVCVHNYLRTTENTHYIPQGFVDFKNNSGQIIPGDWRVTVFDKNTSDIWTCWLKYMYLCGKEHKRTV